MSRAEVQEDCSHSVRIQGRGIAAAPRETANKETRSQEETKRNWIVILPASVRIGVILAFIALAPVSPRTQEQRSQSDSQGNRATPLISPAPAKQPPFSQQEPRNPENKSGNWHEWFWPPVWSNWALFGAAIWGGRIALKTLKSLRQQTRANLLGVRANRRAANAAQMSADIAKDALHLTQRADVQLESGKEAIAFTSQVIHELVSDTRITLNFRNGGPTAAKRVSTDITVFLDGIGQNVEFPHQPKLDIGPHGIRGVSVSPNKRDGWYNVTTLKRINDGTATFDISIAMTYEDIFGTPHQTNVTVRFRRPGGYFAITEYSAS